MDNRIDLSQPPRVPGSSTMRRGQLTLAWWFGSAAVLLLIIYAWASSCVNEAARTNCDDAFAIGMAVMFGGPIMLVVGFVIAFGVLALLANHTPMRSGVVAGSVTAVVGLVGAPLMFVASVATGYLF